MTEQSEISHLKNLSGEKIETERLLLIPVSMDYVNQMMEELTEEITRYMAIYPPKSVKEEVDFVNNSLEKAKKGTDLTVIILDKNTNEYLGGAGIHHLDTKTPEFGIWTKKAAHGKKIGREAVRGLKSWADQNYDFDYYIYPVHKDNIPSRKIAESLGGTVVASEIKVTPWGKRLDEVIYHVPQSK